MVFLIISILSSCAVKKYVPEDQFLFTGADLSIELDSLTDVKNVEALKVELEKVLTPEPNTTFLGMRPGLHYYYKVNKDSAGFISRFLNKKIGEKPVYLADVEQEATRDLLRNRLENRGFFFSNITSQTSQDEKSKEGKVSYSINLPNPYRLKTYQVDKDSIPFYHVLEEQVKESPIEIDSRFDLSALKTERERIDNNLKNKGYYNFNSRFLIFQADSNQYDNRKFDLFVKLKKDVPSKAVKPYRIEKVNVYPYNVAGQDSVQNDTVMYANKNYIQSEEFFRPDRLDDFILLEKGDLYSPSKSKATSRRLGTIGAYKFVNIEYTEIDQKENDSLNFLEANIYLSPLNKRAIRTELQAVTKSNDFTGPTLGVTFSNRNLFKGGELLNINATGTYEVQIAGNNEAGLTSTEFGLGADLIFPRMLAPFKVDKNYFEYSIPKTKASLKADILNRSQLYSLLTFSGDFGYIWQANKYVTHEIDPISINYVRPSNISDEFQAILDNNVFLESSFDQQFISGLTYAFTYNGMLRQNKKSLFYVHSTFDIAGNSISLLSQENDEGKNEFLGLEYAQYAKADVDFRYHYRLTQESKIATRLFAGYGLPYGNSTVLPFSKQYFSGGAYSVRAFRTRSLGPGTYRPENADDRSFFDQSGNIRLEANVEYRFPIYSYFKGAIFADAGNVWTTAGNGLEGGEFGSNFINEFGIGAGIGLRVDVQGFVIRFDLAAPWHDPSEVEGERWNFDVANPVFNFAIGYPF
ncbi:outer membrane protein assembly factor BamA [Nonlabens dokdonensis]|jgi:outer membrane protein assembly factor BamA|uniref:Outer membrane protein assembly factor BamA n=2 Tax=Nonlabens dokdonensis TaxID=328515 RepID=A0ABX5PUK4_9FLAO|nr:BamA/TamA family outer membrane protein [Nonlabens dokdonensis]AGC78101.1 putative outer membrane protein/surface antigen [Nonlabens dokdonensis DSW-6]PZX37163.1 outer membrane protein assembly factor BamA [Nonlabens dokdonensis]